MNPLLRYGLIGLVGCVGLTLIMSVGLSIAVNYGLAQLEQKAADFLPTTPPTPTLTPP